MNSVRRLAARPALALAALSAAVMVLPGCRVDAAHRFELHPDRTVTVTSRAIIDEGAYKFLTSAGDVNKVLHLDQARSRGWRVQTEDALESHIVTATKTITLASLVNKGALYDAQQAMVPVIEAFFNAPRKSGGVFTDTATISVSVSAQNPRELQQVAYVQRPAVEDALVQHLEIKVPGKVLETNGETTPDGYMRWTVTPKKPTVVRYTVETLSAMRLGIILALGAIVLFALSFSALRRRRTTSAA